MARVGCVAIPRRGDWKVAYAYDAADNLLSITYPSGRIVSYARD